MRRPVQRIGIGAGALLGLLLLIVLLLFLAANTAPGRRLVASLVPRFTDGSVHVAGLSGFLPGKILLKRVTLSDASGNWLTARDVTLDWRPLALLGGRTVVERLTAAEAELVRLPVANAENASPSPARPEKPVPLIVRALDVERLEISPALSGRAIDLTLKASGERTSGGVEALKIDAVRIKGGGVYRLDARLTPKLVALSARLEEPAGGLLAGLGGLSLPGPISIDARLSGPRSRIAVALAATAGPLRVHASGDVDLSGRTADLGIEASAPAMQPRPGVGWQKAVLKAHLDGPFAAPRLAGSVEIAGLAAAGARISRIRATVTGSGGLAHLTAQFAGIVLPGPQPDLLAKAPLLIDASARLDAPGRPVSFTARHPLLTIQGAAETAGEPRFQATIRLPDLEPLAAIAGLEVSGGADIRLSGRRQASGFALSAQCAFALNSAPAPMLPLLGAAPHLSLAAGWQRDTITLSRLSLFGRAFSFSAHGDLSVAKTSLDWQAELPELGQLDTSVQGSLTAKGTLEGPGDDLSLTTAVGGTLGTATLAPRPFHAAFTAAGLPVAPRASLAAEVDLDGAPLALALKAAREGANTLAVTIEQAHWKSAHAQGGLTIGPGALPGGRITFAVGRLGDFSSLLGTKLGGSAAGSLTSMATPSGPGFVLDLDGENLAASGVALAKTELMATLLHPLAAPRLEATMRISGARAGKVAADALISVSGPLDALALHVNADSASFGTAHLSAAALIDAASGSASLSALTAAWRGQSARLLAPARLVFTPGIAIEGVRLGMAGAELDAGGKISPHLALTLALRNVTPALLAPFLPHLAARGRFDARAKLAGSLSAPSGTLQLHATNLGLASSLTAGLPAAKLDLAATLAGHAAHIQGALAAGSATRLAVSGTVPLSAAGALDLSVNGRADLALLEPVLSASGRHIAGSLALAAFVRGPLTAPAVTGTASLTGGAISDYASGFALTRIEATLAIADGNIRIRDFHARAGPGTISLAGSVGALQSGIPVSLTLTAENALLLQSDLITVRLDSHLALTGLAEHALAARGDIHIRRAQIQIPKALPPNIAVLHVVRPGAKPPPARVAQPDIALDLTLEAASKVFVRGRGVDAEFGGRIHVGGTSAAPRPDGSFQLIRGQVSLAGQTLAFTSGTIGFNGGNPADPTLDLIATTSRGTTTATLTIGGTVSKPTVTLSSAPELPQDQVLAALLFGAGSTTLSPLQIAEMAGALASLTGTGPSVGDPLGVLRKGLGLDQLTIGSGANGQTAVQAGRYIAPGVYLGASQSTTGAGAQAQMQVNLTKHLKLQATVGNGAGSATAIDGATQPTTRTGSSVGLTWQFEY